MPEEVTKPKSFLFVDDDPGFLSSVGSLFSEMARGRWHIFTAQNHAQALALLAQVRADVVVLDIGMPVMDGVKFLQLLRRAYPEQQLAMLTGLADEESRKVCLESGAALFLEKPTSPGGYASVFAALDTLSGSAPQAGFSGMMRRVGLQEVLQMECLGRKSSLLEVFTDRARGHIAINEGTIVHAEYGSLRGEVALYGLLALRGGEFNLLPFAEPRQRTIQGAWESLLMEAARLTDEGQVPEPGSPPPAAAPVEPVAEAVAAAPPGRVRIAEVVLCSGAGEVLHEWQTKSLELRLRLLEQVENQAAQLGALGSVGRFERLEVFTTDGRIVCQIQPDRRLFVRSAWTQNPGA